MFRSLVTGLVAALCLVSASAAQADEPPFIAGADYDPAVPSVQSVVGHAVGADITRSADVRRYFEALRAAAPDRVVIGDYARTVEGRPTFWVALGSPRNIARLDEIKAASRSLADPRRTTPAQAQALIADMPVIVWLAYSVHGNEISPADASMALARHLLASRDAATRAYLDNVVVVMIPTQNPDGRERFLSGFNAGRGPVPDADELSAERDEPWPSGRYNHALFDLNRDWFIQTQPETQGHAALVRDWRPQVVIDAHEMGTDETFFFPPEAQPLNPWIFPRTLENRALFGRNTAARFDQAGLEYFTGKVFDAFYPGYGDGWPGYLGAVSMTYEQGSARGLMARTTSGDVFTYRDTVLGHFTAELATVETASRNRARLLNDFYDFHRDGLAGRGAWVLSRGADPAATERLAGLLVRSGIEVGRARAAFTACGRGYGEGDYVINLSQPQRRMAEVLLTRDVPLDSAFMAEQERRRSHNLGDEIYDVTAWSLPLMFGVDAARCNAAPGVAVEARGPELVRPVAVADGGAAWGYLVRPGTAGTRFLAAALVAGLDVRSADKPFVHEGRNWPSGTLILPRAGNPADLSAAVARLAASTGAEARGVASSWVEQGPSFGSADVVRIRAPRVAMAWDMPTNPESAGSIRWVLEREMGYPVTAIRTSSLTSADLSRYQVLILPEGWNYKGVLGADGVTNLRRWVENGGVLIGVGSATRLLTAADSELLASRREQALAGDGEEAAEGPSAFASETEYRAAIAGGERAPDSVAGILARASVDPDHWLSAGLPSEMTVLVRGSDIYAPLKRGEGDNVVRLLGADQLLASGQLWAENRRQLAFKPVAMVSAMGRGQIIAFTQDVTLRGYLEAEKPLFLNAVFRGPAHASPNW